MRSLEFAPELSARINPDFERTFSGIESASFGDLVNAVTYYCGAELPIYDLYASPMNAINDGHRSVHCAGRSALIHALLAPDLRVNPVIVEVDYGQDSRHFFNAVHSPEQPHGKALIIENWVADDGTTGLLEIVEEPKEVKIVDPLVHAPIYEGVVERIRRIQGNAHPSTYAQSFELLRLAVPVEPVNEDDPMFYLEHVRPSELPEQSILDSENIEVLSTTKVTVHDPLDSNVIADTCNSGQELAFEFAGELVA